MDDYARVADVAALSFGNGTADTPLTMEMWIRPDQVTGRHQLLNKSGADRVAIIYSTLVVDLFDESTGGRAEALSSGVDLSAWVGGWHHLAVTYDGRGGATAANGITVYLDGAPLPLWRSTSNYVAMENRTAVLAIGQESAQWDQYDGALDELRLWNVVRTPAELAATRNVELAGTEPGLVAYWRFNEGTGLAVAADSLANNGAALATVAMWLAGGPLP